MKKHILFLICGLLMFTACKLEDSYTQTNVQDLVTVKGDYLVNDYGYSLTVVQDAVGAVNWKVEGARYLALYDVLNRNLDINLKEMVRSRQASLTEYDESVEYPTDPVEPYMAAFSGGYLNLGFFITKAKNSDNAHPIRFFYDVVDNQMTMYVVHYGNNEDLRTMSKDDLEYEDRVYHIEREEFTGISTLTMKLYYLEADATGAPVLREGSYDIR
jgi:hypothetical protein